MTPESALTMKDEAEGRGSGVECKYPGVSGVEVSRTRRLGIQVFSELTGGQAGKEAIKRPRNLENRNCL